MITHRLHSVPLLFLLAICLLATPVTTFGYVWCVGSDGHTAVETANAGSCVSDNHFEATESPACPVLAVEDCCGPCLDISASHHWGSSRPRRNELPDTVLPTFTLPAIVAAAPLLDLTRNAHRFVDPSPRIPDPILHHRTIVLLI